ncbi:MAG: response regulator [Pseudomonadales bacterium]|nr:response regulator [Pseudomonadales bacterium]
MQKRISNKAVATLVVLFICAFPFTLNLLGVDFSSRSISIDPATLAAGVNPDQLFAAMAGALHHALLEWSAVSIAFIVMLASFLHYRRREDVTVPIIGLALFCAGLVDSFHTLAATRVISASAPNTEFIPFTWALSRVFNAAIMILGLSISLWFGRRQMLLGKSVKTGGWPVLTSVAVLFCILSYAVVAWAASSDQLPQTMFPDALITRPYDVLPLALFLVGGTLMWTWYKQKESIIKFALLLSLMPEVSTQLHMAFGSTALFDNHFNIAHFLKIVAYSCILLGILLDSTASTGSASFVERRASIPRKLAKLDKQLFVGRASRPQLVLIPLMAFTLAITITLIVSWTFYLESGRLLLSQERAQLASESKLLKPLLSSIYRRTASDVLFLSQAAPIQGLISAINKEDTQNENLWRKSLETIFSQKLMALSDYVEIRYIGLENAGRVLVGVTRNTAGVHIVPQSRLSDEEERNYFTQTITLHQGELFFSKIELSLRDDKVIWPHRPILRVATPVFDMISGDVYGLIVVSVDFTVFIDVLTKNSMDDVEIFLANAEGDFIYHPDKEKSFGFDLGGRYLMQQDFPELKEVIEDNKESAYLSSTVLSKMTRDSLVGFYQTIYMHEFGAVRPLRLLVTFAEEHTFSQLQNFRNQSLLLGISLALIALGLAVLFSRRLLLPLLNMINVIDDYEKFGSLSELPTNAKDEVGVLARSFHNMLVLKQSKDNELAEQKFALDQHAIVAMTDVKGTITFVNELFSQVSGYSQEELLGQNHRMLNSGRHDDALWKNMYRTIAAGNVWQGELCNRKKNGDIYWLDTTIVPFIGETGKPKSYIAIRTDITETKLYEEALIEARDSAESAARVKSEFLASMSHEIRTPINGVLGMLKLLLRDSLTQSQTHKVDVALNSAESLLMLINDILDFSKIEAGKLEIEMLDFNLRTLLGEFSSAMALRVQEKGLELVLDLKGVQHSMVVGDPSRLRQILTNLVGNAIKFTEHGEIVIRAGLREVAGDQLIFYGEIKDTGIGIPAEKQAALFDSFTQVDASITRKFGGSGLGLSIVKQLCDLMEGGISVASEVGAGSSFEFSIPLRLSTASQHVLPAVDISKLEILLVDDNATNRRVITEQLKTWGAKVQQAASGEEAIALCQARLNQSDDGLFDLAFIDMQMPVMDGVELSKQLRMDSRMHLMKLIMMTPMAYQGGAGFFADLGFYAFFPKPITTVALFDALLAVAEGGNALPTVTNIALSLATSEYIKETEQSCATKKLLQSKAGQFRFLLVDDNRVNQEVALGMLEELGLTADIAHDGKQALECLLASEAQPYDVVFMDCQMPVMDGYSATRAIRASEAGAANKDVFIVAMTANALAGDKEKCLQAGMNDYLSKPLDGDKLTAILIKRLLPQGSTVSAIDVEMHVVSEVEKPPSDLISDFSDFSDFSELSPWHEGRALKRMAGKQKRLNRILSMYEPEAKNDIQNMQKAVDDACFNEINQLSHKIKGVAQQISADYLAAIAGLLETLTAQESVSADDRQKIKTLWPLMRDAHHQLCSLINDYLDDGGDETCAEAGGSGCLSSQELMQILTSLSEQLDRGDYVDSEKLQYYRHANKDVQCGLDNMVADISRFDFPTALNTIEGLTQRLNRECVIGSGDS